MASNRKQPLRKTVANSDALTGDWLRDDLPRLVWHDHDPARHAAHRTAIPIRLHSRAEERVSDMVGSQRDRLGCHEMTGALLHYLAEGERSDRRKRKEWWRDITIIDALYQHAESDSATFSIDELDVALTWHRMETIEGYTHYWIKRACARVQRYLRRIVQPEVYTIAA